MATATKTRKPRSLFQADEDFASIVVVDVDYVVPSNVPTDPENRAYGAIEHVHYVNPEHTIAVISHRYQGYGIAVKTDLAVADVLNPQSHTVVSEHYEGVRARGIWVVLLDLGKTNKTSARESAERLQGLVQDVQRPLDVSLDGQYGPALTIALRGLEEESEYRQKDSRIRRVQDIAADASLHPQVLALALAQGRFVWSTPPVAPKQAMVVVREEATANLTERLVDEVVLSTGWVEGLGRIVHEGSVAEFLLQQRTHHQALSVNEVLKQRESLLKALSSIAGTAQRLIAEVEEGKIVGRGFYDTLRIGNDVETAQAAATAYATAIQDADLPTEFLDGLAKNAYADPDDARWLASQVRSSLKALAVITGADYGVRGNY